MLRTIAFDPVLKQPLLAEKIRALVTARPKLNEWNERMTKHAAEYLEAKPEKKVKTPNQVK